MRKKFFVLTFFIFMISIKRFLTPCGNIVHESVFIIRDLGTTQFVYQGRYFLVTLFFYESLAKRLIVKRQARDQSQEIDRHKQNIETIFSYN